jgi:hypothetical protein
LQTLPIQRLAHQLQEYMKVGRVEQTAEGGVIGGVIGSVLKGL